MLIDIGGVILCWKNSRREILGKWHYLQPKILGLWIFFFIFCLTFSLLLNVGLRLTLGYT